MGDNWLVLDTSQPPRMPVVWVKKASSLRQRQMVAESIDAFIDGLIDPTPKTIFGFQNYQKNSTLELLEFLRDSFELYFAQIGRGGRAHHVAKHFWWKNKGMKSLQ